MTAVERVSRETFRSFSNLLLAVRMSTWVVALPLAKRAVPIARLARLMWLDQREERSEERQLFTTRLACRLTRFSGANCLDRSLILYRYLAGEGADPTLVLGVPRAGAKRAGGHAWVVVDGAPVVESAHELARYEPVVAFGAGGDRVVDR